jgi:hypothetical protein
VEFRLHRLRATYYACRRKEEKRGGKRKKNKIK